MKGQTYKRGKCPAGDPPRRAGETLGNCRRDQGSWYYRHDLPTGADGRRRQVCRGLSTEKEARAALTDALARLDRGRCGGQDLNLRPLGYEPKDPVTKASSCLLASRCNRSTRWL